MFEKPDLSKAEQGPEKHPSESEVSELFEKLTNGQEFAEIKKEIDDIGIREWEIRITNEDGSTTEYLYGRKGEHARGHREDTTIHVAHFDADGYPEGGNAIMKYREGRWEEVN